MRARHPFQFGIVSLLAVIAVASASGTRSSIAAAQGETQYAYATQGVRDYPAAFGVHWKLLLDPSNLGGKELEIAEVTLPPGTATPAHTHGSVEVIYVLSGTYEHEVNGERYRLTPGMIGIVRPGDHVRHIVSKSGTAKLLIIWAPGGEAERILGRLKGTAMSPVKPVEAAAPSP
jgi:quercetin dioxygenase-like cupin family protein